MMNHLDNTLSPFSANPDRKHLLTVALEDYFQVGTFNRMIQRGQWYRFETRLEKNTQRTLDLLDQYGIQATFFVLGWIADRFPELVRRVADRGHEVASKGYYHRGINQMSPQEFRDDAIRSRESIERAAQKKVWGYRVADKWLHPEELWALDALAEAGYRYDSSIAPIGRTWVDQPWRRFIHEHQHEQNRLWEFPISTSRILGFQVPIAGGNYFRQLPTWLIRSAIAKWHRKYDAPLVTYFHVWELDPDQPKLNVGSWLAHIRHYRNLHKMQRYLEYFFQRYSFTNVADYLKLSTELKSEDLPQRSDKPRLWHPDRTEADDTPVNLSHATSNRIPVSIIIPCYNEELILPYLSNTLKSVEKKLSTDYQIQFLLVDDGSKDQTWEGMRKTFGDRPGFELYRHEVNQGVAAAIMTGLSRAKTEIVCSMDCDCTYDPHELANMIPLLQTGIDLVTASPYHPQGHVRNVPGWRLTLSKGASFLYRRVLRQNLFTYTSCFRVYRRSAVANLALHYPGYLGIAELLGKLDLQGSRIVEYPATLEVRMLGRSKMKTLRTIIGHLKLMSRLLGLRLANWWNRSSEENQPATKPLLERSAVSGILAIPVNNLTQESAKDKDREVAVS